MKTMRNSDQLTLISRIWRADGFRKSRLHDEKGNRLPLAQFRHLPTDVWLVLRRVIAHRRPNAPWITFDAMTRLDRLLEKDWTMVEFGSGTSTLWFSERVRSILSVEHDPEWYELVKRTLPPNAAYELRNENDYASLENVDDKSLDLVVVDGIRRAECVQNAVPKIRPGGWLFLDNSDKDMTVANGDLRVAELMLREAVASRGGQLEQATGLVIGTLITNQWMLAKLD